MLGIELVLIWMCGVSLRVKEIVSCNVRHRACVEFYKDR